MVLPGSWGPSPHARSNCQGCLLPPLLHSQTFPRFGSSSDGAGWSDAVVAPAAIFGSFVVVRHKLGVPVGLHGVWRQSPPPSFHASAARAATVTSSVDDPPLRLRLPPPRLLVIAFAGLTCPRGCPCPCRYQRSRRRGRPLVVVLGSNFSGE